MKALKIILACLAGIAITFGTFKITLNKIEKMNSRYSQENPVVTKKKGANEDAAYPKDIDKMISHIVNGSKETTLPVKYEKNYTIYEGKLYVTENKGKTWIQVPNDDYLGYAGINEYLDTISQSNIYVASNKAAAVYGGRGSENICIISTESKGEVWSVGSISKTATHDLQKGYDKMYIDFLEDNKTAYIAVISNVGTTQEKIQAYRSVNTGVTWDYVDSKDRLYNEILARFRL